MHGKGLVHLQELVCRMTITFTIQDANKQRLIETQATCPESSLFCLMIGPLLWAIHALYKSSISSNNHEIITISRQSSARGSYLFETAISMTRREGEIYYLHCFFKWSNIMNNTAMNMRVHIFFWICIWGFLGYIP